MHNPKGHCDPKKPYFSRVLAIFSHFRTKMHMFQIFFIHIIFKISTYDINLDIILKKLEHATPKIIVTAKNHILTTL